MLYKRSEASSKYLARQYSRNMKRLKDLLYHVYYITIQMVRAFFDASEIPSEQQGVAERLSELIRGCRVFIFREIGRLAL